MPCYSPRMRPPFGTQVVRSFWRLQIANYLSISQHGNCQSSEGIFGFFAQLAYQLRRRLLKVITMIVNENPLCHKCELRQGQARVFKSSHEIRLLSYRLQVQNRGVGYPEKETIALRRCRGSPILNTSTMASQPHSYL